VRQIPSLGLHVYAASLLLAASATAGALTMTDVPMGNSWVVVGLALVAAYAERNSVRLTTTTEVSISLVPTLFAAILYGPLAAMLVAALSNVADLAGPSELRHLKWATYTATRSISAATAALMAAIVEGAIGSDIAGIAVATVAASLILEALDVAFAATTYRVRGNGHMSEVIRTLGPLTLASIPLYAPIVALLVFSYREISPWTLPLFMVPALAAQRLYALYQAQRHLTADVTAAKERLERAGLSFATALVATLDARDRYTAGHSAAVAIYSRDIAARMGLSADEEQLAHMCGLVHDIGKIGLPPGLVEKPGALTLEERRQMEAHSSIGERILLKVEDYADVARIVRHHHERVDGRGYPDGIGGDEIPLISRIVAVADAYNAMTSDRPYRDAMPTRVARLRLAQAVETQFDTSVVAAFEAILAGATEDYRLGQRRDFTLGSQENRAVRAPQYAISAVAAG